MRKSYSQRRCGELKALCRRKGERSAGILGERRVTPKKAIIATKLLSRPWQVGLAASLMLTVSPVALHAEVSNAELAKEIAELKAQIRALRGGVSEARKEARHASHTRVVAAPAPAVVVPPPSYAAIPPGATPVFVTADKKMQYGALTITPGGFIAMETAGRTRAEGAGLTSAFGSIPTNNSSLAHTGEERFEARQSRFALLAEAPISKSMLVSGYIEGDFLGAGTTSNFNQTNSYVPRIRHLYATLDNTDYGLHVLAGQEWSLVTLNSKGITPRNEVTPPQIDPAYVPGFEYARVPQIRVVKDFNKKLWLALDLEASQTANINGCGTTVSNTGATIAPTGVLGTAAAGNLTTANCQFASTAPNIGQGGLAENVSFNKLPDLLGKVAYEARVGDRDIHLEAEGLVRDLYTNVNYGTAIASTGANPGGFPSSSNQDTIGYGVGAGLIVPVLPRRLDFQIQGLIGRGIGRYASSNGLPDAAITPTGKLSAVGAASALTGLIAHVTPSFDVYGFAGFEQVNRDFSVINGAEVGYGLTTGTNNYGCTTEGGTCAGQTHRVWQVTGGFWDKLYKGSFGEVRVGAQYSFTERQLFAATSNTYAVGPTAAAPLRSATATDNTILTSLRYYPFQ